jgi:hypothetical protein
MLLLDDSPTMRVTLEELIQQHALLSHMMVCLDKLGLVFVRRAVATSVCRREHISSLSVDDRQSDVIKIGTYRVGAISDFPPPCRHHLKEIQIQIQIPTPFNKEHLHTINRSSKQQPTLAILSRRGEERRVGGGGAVIA